MWDSPIHWLDIRDIPLFSRDDERAAAREEAPSSPYENWIGALAGGARAIGARVGLDGNGGDQLFAGTDIYLSDLLRTGHWLSLGRELLRKRRRGARHLFASTVTPLVPEGLRSLIAALTRSAPPRQYLEGDLPAWLRSDFVERHALRERERAHLPPVGGRDRAGAQLRWAVLLPMTGYLHSLLQPRFLSAGVLSRTPLMDRRVVELALTRPHAERVGGLDAKHLLREAMRGLLPESVLAPRTARTGMTLSYSRRSMQEGFPDHFRELMRSPMILAELGVVEPEVLEDSVAEYLQRGGEHLRMDLYHTLQTELWLRARRDANCVEPGATSPFC